MTFTKKKRLDWLIQVLLGLMPNYVNHIIFITPLLMRFNLIIYYSIEIMKGSFCMITYKKYKSTDIEVYTESLKIRNDLLRLPIGKDIFEEDLSIEKENIFFGAFKNSQIIGTLSYFEETSYTAHLTAFAITKEFQKKGIGKKLVTNLIQHLRSKNFEKVVVDAREEAVEFYKKCGFIVLNGPILNKHLNVCDFEMQYNLKNNHH